VCPLHGNKEVSFVVGQRTQAPKSQRRVRKKKLAQG